MQVKWREAVGQPRPTPNRQNIVGQGLPPHPPIPNRQEVVGQDNPPTPSNNPEGINPIPKPSQIIKSQTFFQLIPREGIKVLETEEQLGTVKISLMVSFLYPGTLPQ